MVSARASAILISAPASGQGKTTVTAGLARQAVREGKRVRVFKTGPDFIDPMILARACGQPVYQLDLWMGGLAHCRSLLHQAAKDCDLILVEGVMGLYDGTPSSADLARQLNLPLLIVIDGSAMAQTFGALAAGLKVYGADLAIHGVVANRVAGAGHAALLQESLTGPAAGISFLGALCADRAIELPDRHLGLVQAQEISDLDARIDHAAQALAASVRIADIPQTPFHAEADPQPPPLLAGLSIAVAHDAALSFVYPANLDLLRAMGATIRYFSPLQGAPPPADAIYLPGGYPELHAAQLAANDALRAALRRHHEAGKPLLAECGGMMVLFEYLVDLQGQRHAMAGILPGETAMQPNLQGLALQSVDFGHGELRGHSFHHSRLRTSLAPLLHARTPRGQGGEAVFRRGALTASYVHFYFPSHPRAAAALLRP